MAKLKYAGDIEATGGQLIGATLNVSADAVISRLGIGIAAPGTAGHARATRWMVDGAAYMDGPGGDALRLVSIGVILDQGAADGTILQLQSSDIVHGMTDIVPTSCYGSLTKVSAAAGGVSLDGFTETSIGVQLTGIATSEDATRSVASVAPNYFSARVKSGAGSAAMSGDRNIAVFASGTTARHVLDSDGDSHQDVGTAWTNFDSYDDVGLLNLMSAHVTRRDDPLRDSFRSWLEQDRVILERARLVTFNKDGHHFVNMSRLAMLHTGAIRQLHARLEKLEKRLLAA